MKTYCLSPVLTSPRRSILLLLGQDEPGEGHAVGVHCLPGRHDDELVTTATGIQLNCGNFLTHFYTQSYPHYGNRFHFFYLLPGEAWQGGAVLDAV